MEQSTRGENLYKGFCVPCHGKQWTAATTAPGSTGDDFLAKYDGKTVSTLFNKILNTMPGSDPGILVPAEVADLIAYLAASSQVPLSSIGAEPCGLPEIMRRTGSDCVELGSLYAGGRPQTPGRHARGPPPHK